MRIYLDSVSVYRTAASQIDAYVTTTSGQHSLTVKAWDTLNNIYKNSQTITVANQSPIAKLTVSPTSGIAPLAVTVSTTGSSDPDGSIASTSIDFGDGTVLSGPNASHTYSNAGAYTVKATVTDNVGASSSATQQVAVTGGLAIGVSVSSPLQGPVYGSPVHFVAQAAAGNPITAMKIYVDHIGVYTVNATQIDTYVAIASGTHAVTVQAWDSSGAVYKNSFVLTVR